MNKINNKFLSVIRVICFTVILILILSAVYKALSWKETSGDYLSSVDQLYSTDDNLIDVTFVGSSHVYNGIYPSILWNTYGISAFDMAISGQDKNSAYHSLVELLKTQSPQVVFVDLYALTYDGYHVEGNLYRNSLSLKPSINSYNLITDIAEPEDVQSHLFRFPIIHTRYKELTRLDFETNPLNKYSRGEHYGSTCLPIQDDMICAPNVDEICDLSDSNREWIDSLIKLSADNNFTLVFFITPYTITYDGQTIINGAIQYATAQGISCLDFNKNSELINIDFSTDLVDFGHLNYLGAQKLTNYIGEWISTNFTLTDHRGDIKYFQWDADAHLYSNFISQFKMNATNDLGDALNIALTNPDYITVLSLEFSSSDQLESYGNTMAAASISETDFLNGGMWIGKNGTLTKVINNDTNQVPYFESLTDSEILRLHYDASYAVSNISIGRTNYNTFGTHATVIVYDTYTQQVIYHGGQ